MNWWTREQLWVVLWTALHFDRLLLATEAGHVLVGAFLLAAAAVIDVGASLGAPSADIVDHLSALLCFLVFFFCWFFVQQCCSGRRAGSSAIQGQYIANVAGACKYAPGTC